MLASLPAFANYGRVMHMSGDVKVNGQTMRKNHIVRGGDKITTGANSTVMVVMADRSVIDLDPNTKFKLEKFSFNRNKPRRGNSIMNLLRGSFRYISGLIGRTNHASAQIRMGTATAGIRGSAAVFGFDGKKVDVKVTYGKMTMTFSDGSTMTVNKSQSGRSNSNGTGQSLKSFSPKVLGTIFLLANPNLSDAQRKAEIKKRGLSQADLAFAVAVVVAEAQKIANTLSKFFGVTVDVGTMAKTFGKNLASISPEAATLMAAITAAVAPSKEVKDSLISGIKEGVKLSDPDADTSAIETAIDEAVSEGEKIYDLSLQDTSTDTTGETDQTATIDDTTISTTSSSSGGGGTSSP